MQIAQMVVNTGGIASLMNVLSCRKELRPIPAILAMGHIAAMSSLLASAVIQSEVIELHLFLTNTFLKYLNHCVNHINNLLAILRCCYT